MIERHFLGWKRPALKAAVDFLVARHGREAALDLGGVLAVVPGLRGGRRLLEVLVEASEERHLELTPPRIITAGSLPEEIFEPLRPVANGILCLLAWSRALQDAGRRELSALTPEVPAPDDISGWLSLAEVLARLARELGAEGLRMADVAARLQDPTPRPPEDAGGFDPCECDERWPLLARLEARYLAQLAAAGHDDPHAARLEALAEGRVSCRRDIVLIAVPDLSLLARRMLEELRSRVTALVFAPADLAERFDPLGVIVTRSWRDARIRVREDQVRIADRPEDQARAAIAAVASWGERLSAEEITIGAADEEVVPHLAEAFGREGLSVHHAAGTRLERSPPALLLAGAADYLDGRRFRDFAALARHPDVEPHLPRGPRRGSEAQCWLTALDNYAEKRLPESLDVRVPARSPRRGEMEPLHGAVEGLLHEISGGPRALSGWAQPIVRFLVAIYDRRPLAPRHPDDRYLMDVLDAIHASLEEVHHLSPALAPETTASEALRLVLRLLAGSGVPRLPEAGAIEVLGWLELPLDDAPALVVTGMNEGRVPRTLTGDPFLPGSLRRRLGLVDNERRHARDAYALSAILATREHLTLIAGRHSASSDPLVPSRLLSACEDGDIPRRIEHLFGEGGAATRSPGSGARSGPPPGVEGADLPLSPPPPLEAPIDSLSVTAFRDYIACPYTFYLKHVLRLRVLDDSSEELDARAFGELAHKVLGAFGRSFLATASEAGIIARHLDALLDEEVEAQYGRRPLPALRIQVEQLRARLHAFARWQAGWRQEGWRIEHVELGVDPERPEGLILEPLEIEVGDGLPLRLKGRIDRIDINERSGERAILDYKTSERAECPEATHRKQGKWVDLQLPLYRRLASAAGIVGPLQLGYITLPQDLRETRERLAKWRAIDLECADDAARSIARKIRAEAFWPPAQPAPLAARDHETIYRNRPLAGAEPPA